MKKIILFAFFITFSGLCFGRDTERLVLIQLRNHDEVYKLNKYDITIIDAGKDYAKALVDDKKIEELRSAGYRIDILIEDYKKYKDEIFSRGFYHTYQQVYLVLDSFATQYPNICRLDTIGLSVQGRAIWAMRVTDNPTIEENEPEIRLAGNIHGDEHIGTEITLYFLRYLLTNYATNPQVQNLVNNREIWILPVLNPDGKVSNTRYNANGVDLNRDYGYFWRGSGGSPEPSSQIENQHFMNHLLQNNITLEYNYHSAAQYVNYVWDYHPADPPDSQHIINLSQIYADSANLTPINGYDWYQVCGSLQDYTFGTSGALAWTIETLEPSGSSQIDQICYDNRDALMDVCNRAGWGIEGVVRDSLTNAPLYARIEFLNPERVCIYTDPNLGDFHKMIQPGTYTVRISANGYTPKTITNVVVPATGSVNLGEIRLAPDSSWLYAFRVVLCRYAQHAEQSNKTQPRYALGVNDNIFYSLGQNGYIVLDMGPNTPIIDISGNDFIIYEGNDGNPEGYTVYAGNNWNGPWYSCGIGNGTQEFDLATAGLNEARYLRIVDDGSQSSGQYAGFDLDAVQFFPQSNIPNVTLRRVAVINDNNGNGQLDPGENAGIVCYVRNNGPVPATNTTARLKTADTYITLFDSTTIYGTIPAGDSANNSNDPFTISVSPSCPIGHTVDFQLYIVCAETSWTRSFNLTVGRMMPSDTGYYYVYWSGGPYQQAPVYSWFAIDTTQTAHPGTSLNLTDDETRTVNLPFTFKYYGVNYTQVSICSNGWLALGSETSTNYNNTGIPNTSAPNKAIYALWDDLNPGYSGQPGDVYYYNDATNHRFVVEWFRVPHYGNQSTMETFEIILYDPAYYPTPTGDGEIVIQYYNAMQETDNTVGIENSAGTVGIQYFLNGTYHSLGVPITAQFALKFTTWPPTVGIEEDEISKSEIRNPNLVLQPNPFIKSLVIRYAVKDVGQGFSLAIYDVTGRMVRDLSRSTVNGERSTIFWDGKDDSGRRLPAGVYFVRLEVDDFRQVEKAILLR